jgi:ABC-type glycerol-3-phosphate transport system substrate-binding protein
MFKVFSKLACLVLTLTILFSATGCAALTSVLPWAKGDLWQQIPGYVDTKIDYGGKDFRIMCYGSGDKPEAKSDKEKLQQLVAKKNNIGKIVWDTVADWQAFQPKLTAEVLANKAPDIVAMPMYWYFPSVTNGLINEIPNAQKLVDESKLYIDKVSLGFKDDGKYYGLTDDSYIHNTEGICYNKDIMKKYSLEDPAKLFMEGKWDFDTFFRYCKTISKDTNGDGATDVFGYACPGTMDGRADAMNFVAANGGEMLINADNKVNKFTIGFTDNKAIEGLNFIKKIVFDNDYASIEINMDFMRTKGLFASGKVGMWGMCAWGMGYAVNFPAGFVGYPKGPSAGNNYHIWNVAAVMNCSPKTTGSKPTEALKVYEQIRLIRYIVDLLDNSGKNLDSDLAANIKIQLEKPESKGKFALTDLGLKPWCGSDPSDYTLPAIRKTIDSQEFAPLEGALNFTFYGKSIINDIMFGVKDVKGSIQEHNPVFQDVINKEVNSPIDKFEKVK